MNENLRPLSNIRTARGCGFWQRRVASTTNKAVSGLGCEAVINPRMSFLEGRKCVCVPLLQRRRLVERSTGMILLLEIQRGKERESEALGKRQNSYSRNYLTSHDSIITLKRKPNLDF